MFLAVRDSISIGGGWAHSLATPLSGMIVFDYKLRTIEAENP